MVALAHRLHADKPAPSWTFTPGDLREEGRMHLPMSGVRVLEAAQYTFVPSAAAVLADWGAEVIKVEHADHGDAQRGLVSVMGLDPTIGPSSFFPIMEGPNRGKRSIGLALDHPLARPVLEQLVRRSDVFLTNYLPRVQSKLGIDLKAIRSFNPDIIYVRGSGFGARGPERNKGGYDSTAFWARAGTGHSLTEPGADRMPHMPTGAYGDNIGGMVIAGGIAAALYARAATGEPSVVDVSLLAVGAWAMQFAVNLAMLVGGPLPEAARPGRRATHNPLSGTYRTDDDRWLMLTMLQPGKYWPEFCAAVGRPELADDPRFADAESIMANAAEAAQIVTQILAAHDLAHWRAAFADMQGQWAAVQDPWELSQDASLRANGYVATVTDADGEPRELVANPVQFDESPARLRRAPQFAEHTDSIILELGVSEQELIELKIAGAVT
jgi:crotonobetainyl-CoA:carnitine CoA-transferase CaiB-like acyl-CoA transferase